jgi:riboflavin kinase/FMN adenylyltransferase
LIAGFDRVHAFYSATNVGVRPTVDGLHRRVESHLLDFPPPGQVDDLYGRALAVDFLFRLRGEKRFATITELVAQIHTDIAQARAMFADAPDAASVR